MKSMWEKHKWLLLVELIILVLAFLGCFRKEELVYSIHGEDIRENVENINDSLYFQSEYIELTRGVYQIRAESTIPEGSALYLHLQCEDSTYMALRCNGATLFAGQEYIDFEAYVLDPVDSAFISCNYIETEADSLINLSLYKINNGSYIFCFLVILGCILLNFFIVFREKILTGQINTKQQVVLWVMTFSVLLAYLPYATDYFNLGADTLFHLTRIEGLKETILQGGQFPIRVQSYWMYNHGYAVSSFYGELFLLIPALLRIIGFSLMTSYKMFVFIVMVATAYIAYYSFSRCTRSTYGALLGSVIYMLMPYRIYNFYNRGAVGEYLAMTFLPLICLGMYLIFTEDINSKNYSKAKIPIIIGLTCILQSHLLSCEMTAFLILLVCVLQWKKTFRKKTFVQLAQAAVITMLLNAWFWFPLLKMMWVDTYILNDLVNNGIQYMGTSVAGILQLFPNIGAAQTGMYNCEPIQIGVASLLMLFLFGVMMLRRLAAYFKKEQITKNTYQGIMLFLFGLILLTMFMSTRYFPWDMLAEVPGINVLVTALQFPTRLLSPASVLSAMFAIFFVPWIQIEAEKWIDEVNSKAKARATMFAKATVFIMAVLMAGSAVYHVNDIVYNINPIRLYTAENMGTIGVVNGEYLFSGGLPFDYSYHKPNSEEGLILENYSQNGLNISVYVNNTTAQVRFLELPIIGYKGYKIDSDTIGIQSPSISQERGDHGDLRIEVPAGFAGSLKVWYGGFASYRIAEVISLVTLLTIVIYEVNKRRKAWILKIK